MKNYSLAFLFIYCLMSLSCSDDETSAGESIVDTPPEKTTLEFANFEIGNYWIYDVYVIGVDGTETLSSEADSVFIMGDTIIDGRNFLIQSSDNYLNRGTQLLFDSANTILTFPKREVLFTLDESLVVEIAFGDLAKGIYALENTKSNISVPAGDFECSNFQGIISSIDPAENIVRINNKFYAEGVGLVFSQDPFFNGGSQLEARLVRFGSN